MAEFFNILIYGDASLLFLLIFIGLGMVISRKVRAFNLVCIVACLFQAINYGEQVPNTDFIWHIVLLMICMCIFAFMLAKENLFP